MAMTAKKLFISGKVQGVSFRFHAHEHASRLHLKGWVKNLHDGRVEMLVIGEEKDVQNMIKWAHHGPEAADVEKVDVSDSKEHSNEAFYIKRDGEKH